MRHKVLRLTVLAIGACAALSTAQRSASAAHLTNWTDIGGNFTSNTPAVTLANDTIDQELDVYGIQAGTGHTLNMEFDITRGTNTGWRDLGGVSISTPTAIAWPNHREVYVVGTDDKLYHSTNYGAYQPLGGPLVCSDPSAVSWGTGRVDIVVRGCNTNHLWHLAWAGSAWNWVDTGIVIQGNPNVSSSAGARLDVWVIDTAAHLRDYQYNGSGWSYRDTGITNVTATSFAPMEANAVETPVVGVGVSQGFGTFTIGDYSSRAFENNPIGFQMYGIPHFAVVGPYVWLYVRLAGGFMVRGDYEFDDYYNSQSNDVPASQFTDAFISDPSPFGFSSYSNSGIWVFAVKANGQMSKLVDSSIDY